MKVKHIEIEGRKVGYFDIGKGNPVLLIHGWSACKESFIPLIKLLKNKYRIIAPDLPGHGDSEELAAEHNLDNHILFLTKFLSGLNIRRTSIMGTSLGATIALKLVLTQNHLIDRLILQAPVYTKQQIRFESIIPKIYVNPLLYPVIRLLSKSEFFRRDFFINMQKTAFKIKFLKY